MSWVEAFTTGAINVFSWPGILIPIAGTLIAMATSFLPGIGTTSVAIVLMVLTLSWGPESALLLFGALTGGATFMGSITAILFNVPGGAPNSSTLLDGYPMGQRGYAKTAIACAATASAVGSVIGVVVLIALLPAVRPILLTFGPLEMVLIGLWGLTTIITLPNASSLKGVMMAALGLLVAMVGINPINGHTRWDFGILELTQGFSMLPVLLGVFTFAELIRWMRRYTLADATTYVAAVGDSVRAGVVSVFRHFGLTFRSSIIGTLVGIIPGIGGTAAGFIAYGQAVQTAKGDRSTFGKGDIRGVIAPEAAADAKDGGSLLPAVALGLPGSEAGVILIAVFAIHGIVPGPAMVSTNLALTFTLILALLFSNILTSVLGVAMTPWLARLKTLRMDRIALPALVISLITVVQIKGQLFDLYTAIGFGIAGYYWRVYNWPRVPFVIAFVLGSFLETNLLLTVQLIDAGRIVPFERTSALILIGMIGVTLLWMRVRKPTRAKKSKAPEVDVMLSLVLAGGTIGLLLWALAGGRGYSPYTLVISGLACAVALLLLVQSLRGLWQNTPAPQRAAMLRGLPGHLAPLPEHRLPLALMALLPLLIWLLGLAAAVGVTALLWYALRMEWTLRGVSRTAMMVGGYAFATWYFVNEIATLILPRGQLWAIMAG